MSRLAPNPRELIDRERTVRFTFDGKQVEAFAGDTIGSAIAASGRRVLSRSFKYHRPRGLFCCAGQCPNCLVEVDGWPGVRACTEPAREGIKVDPHERESVAATSTSCGRPTWSASASPRPASTTRPSSGRGACGRSTRRSSAMRRASDGSRAGRPSAGGGPSIGAATPTSS